MLYNLNFQLANGKSILELPRHVNMEHLAYTSEAKCELQTMFSALLSDSFTGSFRSDIEEEWRPGDILCRRELLSKKGLHQLEGTFGQLVKVGTLSPGYVVEVDPPSERIFGVHDVHVVTSSIEGSYTRSISICCVPNAIHVELTAFRQAQI